MKKRLTVVKRRRKVLITPWTVRSTYTYSIEGGSHVTLTGHARAGMGHRS
jgi:hypothetical protein